MFVFSSKDIKHIIETTITTMEPTRSRSHKPIPAYVLFLAARFAHYFSSPELLEELLEATILAIKNVTKVIVGGERRAKVYLFPKADMRGVCA
jgi:hypothetical protein